MLSNDLIIFSFFKERFQKSEQTVEENYVGIMQDISFFPSLLFCNLQNECHVDGDFTQIGCQIQSKNCENKYI